MIRRILRAPLLRMLALGAVVFLIRRERPVAASAPSDDELLYRAAVRLGVDRSDRAVRARLARLGGFVEEDETDAASREAEARRLGLDRTDVVVRRQLAEVMRLAAGRIPPDRMPTERELASRTADYAIPERIRLTHVFLRRGARSDADARRLLDSLRREHVPPDRAPALGDAFVTGPDVGPATAEELDRRFGAGFGQAIADARPGGWVGPIPSVYGLHLVWVHERRAAEVPRLDAVRGQVLHRLLRERRDAQIAERLAALRR
jgi:hypothetical protein